MEQTPALIARLYKWERAEEVYSIQVQIKL